MITFTYKHIPKLIILISLIVIFTMPDLLVGFLLGASHFLFEWLETLLDNIVEHVFETELHETQTIVFYILSALSLVPIYFLWRILPKLFHLLHSTWLDYKSLTIVYWQSLSLKEKIKISVISIIGLYLASFLVM